MNIVNKYFIIILLLLIINILIYVFISENVNKNDNVDNNVDNNYSNVSKKEPTIPNSKLGAEEYKFNMYYTEWCSYSQKAKPGFVDLKKQIEKINKNRNTHINVNLIDVEDASNSNQIKKDLKHLKIESYPTILLLNGTTRLITKYTGQRNLNSYVEFLNANVHNVDLNINS